MSKTRSKWNVIDAIQPCLYYQYRNDPCFLLTDVICIKTLKGEQKIVTYYPIVRINEVLLYIPILPLWAGVILSRSNDEHEYKSSNAIAENRIRRAKQPIMEDKVKTIPSDFIHTVDENIPDDRVSVYKIGFHPLTSNF